MLTSAVGGKQLCCFGSNGYWRVFQHPTGVQPTCCEGIETGPKIAAVPSSRSASIGGPPPDRFRHQDPRRKAGFGVNLGWAPLYDPSPARCSSRPGRCMACRSRIWRSRVRRIPPPSAPGGARSSSCGTVIGFEARHHLQQRDGGDVPDQGQQVLPRLPMPWLPPIRGRARIAPDPTGHGDRDARAGGRCNLGGGPAPVRGEPRPADPCRAADPCRGQGTKAGLEHPQEP